MKLILPTFLFFSSFISGLVTGQQKEAAAVVNQFKTVVIYSSDDSFFEDYPIDSMVEHLNLVNENPRVRYYKNSGDDSKTGFSADYLVDVKVSKSEHEFVIPKIKEVPVTRPVMRAIQEAGGTVRYELAEGITHFMTVVEHTTEPKRYYLAMQAFRKNPYKKFRKTQWDAKGDLADKAAIIIKLIYELKKIGSE
jgi:hypothetical protein